MDLQTMRILVVIGSIAAVILYIYRIRCLVNLMCSNSPKVEGNNKLIYAGLILFIPLGIGGWIYDFVVNKKKVSALFLFPFVTVMYTVIQATLAVLPHATEFNFDYMLW